VANNSGVRTGIDGDMDLIKYDIKLDIQKNKPAIGEVRGLEGKSQFYIQGSGALSLIIGGVYVNRHTATIYMVDETCQINWFSCTTYIFEDTYDFHGNIPSDWFNKKGTPYKIRVGWREYHGSTLPPLGKVAKSVLKTVEHKKLKLPGG
jgi:hypothetical protein